MGGRPDGAVGILGHQDAPGPEALEEGSSVAPDAEQDEVRADPVRVQLTQPGLGDPSCRLDPIEIGQALGKSPGVGVVIGQPLDHPVGSIAQGNQAGRGEDAHLAQAATASKGFAKR